MKLKGYSEFPLLVFQICALVLMGSSRRCVLLDKNKKFWDRTLKAYTMVVYISFLIKLLMALNRSASNLGETLEILFIFSALFAHTILLLHDDLNKIIELFMDTDLNVNNQLRFDKKYINDKKYSIAIVLCSILPVTAQAIVLGKLFYLNTSMNLITVRMIMLSLFVRFTIVIDVYVYIVMLLTDRMYVVAGAIRNTNLRWKLHTKLYTVNKADEIKSVFPDSRFTKALKWHDELNDIFQVLSQLLSFTNQLENKLNPVVMLWVVATFSQTFAASLWMMREINRLSFYAALIELVVLTTYLSLFFLVSEGCQRFKNSCAKVWRRTEEAALEGAQFAWLQLTDQPRLTAYRIFTLDRRFFFTLAGTLIMLFVIFFQIDELVL